MAFNTTLYRNRNRGDRLLGKYPNGDSPVRNQNDGEEIFESFENGIYQINPLFTQTPWDRDLWGQEPDGIDSGNEIQEPGTTSIQQTGSLHLSNHLNINVEPGGALYLNFNRRSEELGGWYYIKEVFVDLLQSMASWENNKYNRLCFFLKVPNNHYPNPDRPGVYSLVFGTYNRATSAPVTVNETGGNHFYHWFRATGSNDRWMKFIVDMHPSYQRLSPITGGTELGEVSDPTEEGLLYFDTMTRFYIDFGYRVYDETIANDYKADKFSVYQETRTENETQVYSICGFYDPATSRLWVSWSRNKDENTLIHDVYYAFSDIHELGIENATAAPGGQITPLGFQGDNLMVYDTTSLDVGQNSSIFIAVRPRNATLFKQIQLDTI